MRITRDNAYETIAKNTRPIFHANRSGVTECLHGTIIDKHRNVQDALVEGRVITQVYHTPHLNTWVDNPEDAYFTEMEEAIAHCRSLVVSYIGAMNTMLFHTNPIKIEIA